MSKLSLKKGRYVARAASSKKDVFAAQMLRSLAFGKSTRDHDSFDPDCTHVLIEEIGTGQLVCCFRILPLARGSDIGQSYSAQYYELSGLSGFQGRMVELGRFCVHPNVNDPDVLRVAWGALTKYVDEESVELLFGCASFEGTDASVYADAFAMLHDHHLAPKRWLPRVKAPKVFRFRANRANQKNAMLRMPPLLKTYLMMGGWVSDHAVVDDHMNTLHVFTGVEIGAIPAARKKLLRAVAG